MTMEEEQDLPNRAIDTFEKKAKKWKHVKLGPVPMGSKRSDLEQFILVDLVDMVEEIGLKDMILDIPKGEREVSNKPKYNEWIIPEVGIDVSRKVYFINLKYDEIVMEKNRPNLYSNKSCHHLLLKGVVKRVESVVPKDITVAMLKCRRGDRKLGYKPICKGASVSLAFASVQQLCAYDFILGWSNEELNKPQYEQRHALLAKRLHDILKKVWQRHCRLCFN